MKSTLVHYMITLALLSVFASAAGAKESWPTAARPNVIVIVADDLGYSDLPKFGKSEIPTPHIDRLADQGVLFTDAYVTAPICVASRMALMTAQYQQRFGMYDNIYGKDKNALFLRQKLLPQVFQEAGYQTALVGKWHLSGNSAHVWEQPGPRERGFGEWVGFRGGGCDYWKGATLFRNDAAFKAPEYLTDYLGREACRFIERNRRQRFFLYLAFNAVHAPLHALPKDAAEFQLIKDDNRRAYAGMLSAMDRSIGKVLQTVDRLKLRDQTIIVFLNDNGGGGRTSRYASHSRNYANNLPLRGHKFDVFEGGVRVPMIMRWPHRLPHGLVYRQVVSSMDIFPTLVQAAGLKMPAGQPCDGVDLIPFLTEENKGEPHQWLCWQNRDWSPETPGGYAVPQKFVHNSAIRRGKWKLVRLAEKINSNDPPPAWQLFDLSRDLGEQEDVAHANVETARALESVFTSWRASMHPSIE